MKMVALLFFITCVSASVYLLIVHLKKFDWKAFKIAVVFGIVLTTLLGVIIFKSESEPKGWCGSFKITNNYPPMQTVSAKDYFENGNYEYDTGNCTEALESYTKSIELNPNYPQAYNNRAYTYMQLKDYDKALADLDRALELNPNYINALMNRGDVYRDAKANKEAAISDYEKIISLSGRRATSVCGHLGMLKHYKNNNPLTYVNAIVETIKCRDGK